MVIARSGAVRQIVREFRDCPAVALLGPRQCGKTTLARMVAESRAPEMPVTVFDLEREADLVRLRTPEQTLGPLTGLVVIDEVQHLPKLLTALRPLIDRPGVETRYLLLGSVSPTIVRGVTESLTGRICPLELGGFDLEEVGGPGHDWRRLWRRGGLPPGYLAPDDEASWKWRRRYFQNFLTKDHDALGVSIPAAALRRYWRMLAHYHGQVWNAAEFARSIGRGEAAARRYLDLLEGAFAVRVLEPWFENLRKRQVKAPKVYVRDSGLFHTLLGLASFADLAGHPKVGASFEGFVIEQLIGRDPPDDSAFFWGTHGGAELDLLWVTGRRRYGVEVKYTDAPRTTRSMRTALADLALERLFIVYPGDEGYPLDERIEVVPAARLPRLAAHLRSPDETTTETGG